MNPGLACFAILERGLAVDTSPPNEFANTMASAELRWVGYATFATSQRLPGFTHRNWDDPVWPVTRGHGTILNARLRRNTNAPMHRFNIARCNTGFPCGFFRLCRTSPLLRRRPPRLSLLGQQRSR